MWAEAEGSVQIKRTSYDFWSPNGPSYLALLHIVEEQVCGQDLVYGTTL